MFKKTLITICIIFSLISCTNKKENYIKENFPKVLNLEKSELDSFKDNMIFDKDGVLTSWQGELLEKAYQDEDEYIFILLRMYNKLGLNPSKIVRVDGNNNERIIQPGLYNVNNEKVSLYEIQKWNAIFYITSTNCGFCLEEYKKMNDLSDKYKSRGIKFVAIFEKVSNIETYKKGSIYKEEGFLNDDWIILQKNNLTPFLTKKYDDSLGFPFVFFRKNEIDLEKYPNPKDHKEIEEILETF